MPQKYRHLPVIRSHSKRLCQIIITSLGVLCKSKSKVRLYYSAL